MLLTTWGTHVPTKSANGHQISVLAACGRSTRQRSQPAASGRGNTILAEQNWTFLAFSSFCGWSYVGLCTWMW